MKLRKVSGCDNGTCPAVYVTGQGTAVVQGDRAFLGEGLDLGAGEAAVELPPDIVLAAVAAWEDSTSGLARIEEAAR